MAEARARAGAPHWPLYALPRRATLMVDVAMGIEDDPRGWQRRLFSTVPYIQPGS